MTGDYIVDVSHTPYEAGFKFNTIPFGGMTIDSQNAVRIGSATDVKLAPAHGSSVVVGSEPRGSNAAESTISSTADLKFVPPIGGSVIVATSGSLPTPVAALRGALFMVQGDSTHADTLQVCLKSATNSYSWKVLATG
jgi:hypothetical protein